MREVLESLMRKRLGEEGFETLRAEAAGHRRQRVVVFVSPSVANRSVSSPKNHGKALGIAESIAIMKVMMKRCVCFDVCLSLHRMMHHVLALLHQVPVPVPIPVPIPVPKPVPVPVQVQAPVPRHTAPRHVVQCAPPPPVRVMSAGPLRRANDRFL